MSSVIPNGSFGSSSSGLTPGSFEYFLSITGNGPPLSQASAQSLARTSSKASKQQATTAGQNSLLPIVYGTRRVGAKVGPVLTYRGNLIIRAQWCLGEVGAVSAVQLNDAELPFGVTATHYTGTATQGVDPTLVAAFAEQGITYTKTLPGVCYSVFSIQPRKHMGFPRLTATIQGLKIRSTSGGARAYSDNPAYIIADFIESTTYGMGRSVDWTTVATVAAACNALVGGEKKRVLSLVLDSAQESRVWLDTLRDYAGCWCIPEGSSYRLVPDAPVVSSGGAWGSTWASAWAPGAWGGSGLTAFSEANIKQGSLRMSKRGTRSTPTTVEVVYTDTTQTPWVDRKLPPVYAPGVLAGTTPRRFTSLPKPGITRYSEAYRYAIERVNSYTLNDLSIAFTAFDAGIKVQVGDVITVSWAAKGLSAKLFRVMKCETPEPGRWNIAADEYDPAKYSSDVVSGPTFPDTTIDDPAAPPLVTGLAVSEDVYAVQNGLYASRLRITWTEPTYSPLASYQIEVTQNGVRQEIGTSPKGTAEYVTGPLKENLLYSVNVSVVSTAGIVGTAATITITNNGKLSLPTDVPSITGFEVGGEVRLSWVPATDLDLTAHEIRYSSTAGSWSTATLIDRVAAPSVRYNTKVVPAGTWRFWIKGLDSVRTSTYPYGQESVNAAYVDITVTSDAAAFVAASYAFTTPLLYHVTLQGSAWVTDFSDTWSSLFTANMSTYTNALNTYHTAGTSTLITETNDFGSSLTGDWSGSFTYSDLAGTAASYLELSSGAEASKTITGATNATPIVITATSHGYQTGDEVIIAGVGGNTAANGQRKVVVLTANTFSITDLFDVNVAGNGAYTSGGTSARWVWASYNATSVKTTAQYGRKRISTTGTMSITSLGSMQCNVVARQEGGEAVVAASGPTIITFANRYNAAVSAQVTARGTVFATGVYDNVEVSGARGVGAGQALLFNGTSDRVEIADSVPLRLATALTIEAQVKLTARTAAFQNIVRKDTEAGTAYAWGLRITPAGKFGGFYNNGTNYEVFTATAPIGRWMHAAMTISGTTLSVYMDGILQGTVTIGGTQGVPTGRMAVGATPPCLATGGVYAEWLGGRIDDVRVWSAARSQAQLQASMNTPLVGTETNLVGYWKFDSTSGTTATDSTSNVNHGTVSGAKWRPLDGMDVYLFDAAGAQISGTAAWAFNGV